MATCHKLHENRVIRCACRRFLVCHRSEMKAGFTVAYTKDETTGIAVRGIGGVFGCAECLPGGAGRRGGGTCTRADDSGRPRGSRDPTSKRTVRAPSLRLRLIRRPEFCGSSLCLLVLEVELNDKLMNTSVTLGLR